MKFEQYAEEANKFIKEVAVELGNAEDTDHALRVTRTVLHTVREIITPDESLNLISQLPMYLKAIYVDSWHLNVKNRIRSMNEFLKCLREKSSRTAGRDFGDDQTAKEKTKAVLHVLKKHVTIGEIQDVIDQFPLELAELWITETREHV